jgi:hypothetical protein
MPTDRRRYDAVVAALRTSLGDAAFERLSVEGARLSLEEAVEPELAVRGDVPPQPPASTRSSAGPRRVTASR